MSVNLSVRYLSSFLPELFLNIYLLAVLMNLIVNGNSERRESVYNCNADEHAQSELKSKRCDQLLGSTLCSIVTQCFTGSFLAYTDFSRTITLAQSVILSELSVITAAHVKWTVWLVIHTRNYMMKLLSLVHVDTPQSYTTFYRNTCDKWYCISSSPTVANFALNLCCQVNTMLDNSALCKADLEQETQSNNDIHRPLILVMDSNQSRTRFYNPGIRDWEISNPARIAQLAVILANLTKVAGPILGCIITQSVHC